MGAAKLGGGHQKLSQPMHKTKYNDTNLGAARGARGGGSMCNTQRMKREAGREQQIQQNPSEGGNERYSKKA